jgi:hypothetical protein
MSQSTNNPMVRSTSGTKNYRTYSETIEALQACIPSEKGEQFLQRPVKYEHLTDSDDDNPLLRYHQDRKKDGDSDESSASIAARAAAEGKGSYPNEGIIPDLDGDRAHMNIDEANMNENHDVESYSFSAASQAPGGGSLLNAVAIRKKGVKQVSADDQTVWTCNTVSNASKETTDMHKIGRDELMNFDNRQESSKFRCKQKFKVTVADIKSTLQQLWGKSEGDLYGDLSQPGQATHQVLARARRIKLIHPNTLARQEHLGSIDPGCLADQDCQHITMLNSTATRSGPLQFSATSIQYMFFRTLPTRQQYYNDHMETLTSFIVLATIKETTHTNDVARIVFCASTLSQGSRSQMMLQVSERFCSQQRYNEDYRPCNEKVARIKEIVLTTTKGQELSRLRQGDPTRKSNVTRFIAIKTTRLRDIRNATLKVTSTRKIPSSPNIIQVSVDTFTGWYILDLMVVKEDIKEYTLSTTEAEYFALPMSLQDVLPIMFLLDKMKCKSSQVICTVPHVHCKIFEYNSGSLELTRLLKFRPRIKHINVCYHHFREHVRSRKVKIFPIGTKDQTANEKHYHKTHASNIASPCVDSNPRCPSKGV